jgi:hypothetical protein
VIADNLREGVVSPDFTIPQSSSARDMLRHYNIVPLPCRTPTRLKEVAGVGQEEGAAGRLRFESLRKPRPT